MNAWPLDKTLPQQDLHSQRTNNNRQSRSRFRKNKNKQKHPSQKSPEWPDEESQRTPSLNKSLKKSSIHNLESQLGRSLTEAKRKEPKLNDLYSDQNIFKLPSSTLLATKINKQDIRLPALDKKRGCEDELDFNPEKRRVVKITIDKLKPVPVDEVKRRFLLKYQIEGVNG